MLPDDPGQAFAIKPAITATWSFKNMVGIQKARAEYRRSAMGAQEKFANRFSPAAQGWINMSLDIAGVKKPIEVKQPLRSPRHRIIPDSRNPLSCR
jgi:hypothetical protein